MGAHRRGEGVRVGEIERLAIDECAQLSWRLTVGSADHTQRAYLDWRDEWDVDDDLRVIFLALNGALSFKSPVVRLEDVPALRRTHQR